MTYEATLAVMLGAFVLGLVSIWQVRRKPKPGKPGIVPWHGVMFLSMLTLVGGAAHLPAVW